jgi:hypothetical protein
VSQSSFVIAKRLSGVVAILTEQGVATPCSTRRAWDCFGRCTPSQRHCDTVSKTGIRPILLSVSWIPAFAGMTIRGVLQRSLLDISYILNCHYIPDFSSTSLREAISSKSWGRFDKFFILIRYSCFATGIITSSTIRFSGFRTASR